MSTKTPIIWVHETDPLHGGIALQSHVRDCPEDLRTALNAAINGNVIEWRRIRSFQDVSLRLMLQKILAKEADERGGDHVYVPTEVTRAPSSWARRAGNDEKNNFHVYVSEHNPGVELMLELEDCPR